MNAVYFIDREGQKKQVEGEYFHIKIARKLIESDDKLKAEFETSKKEDPSDFLTYNKGWLKVTSRGYAGRCTYYSRKLSEKQRKFIAYFTEHGYDMDDLFLRELQKRRDTERQKELQDKGYER